MPHKAFGFFVERNPPVDTRDFFKDKCSLCGARKKKPGEMICAHPNCATVDKILRDAFVLLDHIVDAKVRGKAKAQMLYVAHGQLDPPWDEED